jgi:hypothetical protein
MAYIGTKPTIGNFQICDAISVVNGQAAYTMQVGSVNVIPQSANHMIVSLNGTIQKPNSSFTVSGSTITFASNLATGDVIDFIQILGDVLDLGVPSDATVTAAKLGANSVTAAKLNNDIISGTTALASEPADTDEFLVSDAGTLKRIDYSLIKASSPGMTLLTSGDITSTTSTIEITGTHITSTHDHYKMIVRGKAAGDGIEFVARYRNSSNNGLITAGYAWRVHSDADNGAGSNNGNDDKIRLTNQSYFGNGANEGFNMSIDFYSPLSTLVPTSMHWKVNGANNGDSFTAQRGMSRRNDGTQAHTGFTLFWGNGGDFANGTNYELYGMAK